MDTSNPPESQSVNIHDKLFKWLISEYLVEFFELFFPQIKTSHIRKMDKEFLERLEENKESLTADLFLALEAEVEGEIAEIVIILELKSKKEDIRQQIRKYFAHAVSSEDKPVWSIVLFTDDASWVKPIPSRIPISFSAREGYSYLVIDIIKLKEHSAENLIKHHTLLAKLMALKANDHGGDREKLIFELYKAAVAVRDDLKDHIVLLIEQFVKTYGKIPEAKVQKIKQEAKMTGSAATITEHYEMIGQQRGEMIGQQRGEIRGQIKLLEKQKADGDLPPEKCDQHIAALKAELQALEDHP